LSLTSLADTQSQAPSPPLQQQRQQQQPPPHQQHPQQQRTQSGPQSFGYGDAFAPPPAYGGGDGRSAYPYSPAAGLQQQQQQQAMQRQVRFSMPSVVNPLVRSLMYSAETRAASSTTDVVEIHSSATETAPLVAHAVDVLNRVASDAALEYGESDLLERVFRSSRSPHVVDGPEH